jgi:hypothetical protein
VARVHAQAPGCGAEQRIGLEDLEIDRPDLAAARILRNASAESLHEQLVSEADPEGRHAGRDECGERGLGVDDPGLARRDARRRAGDDERAELRRERPFALFRIEHHDLALPCRSERFANHSLERTARR